MSSKVRPGLGTPPHADKSIHRSGGSLSGQLTPRYRLGAHRADDDGCSANHHLRGMEDTVSAMTHQGLPRTEFGFPGPVPDALVSTGPSKAP